MKNTINNILRHLYGLIPKEILELTFEPQKNNRTLDSMIKEIIIVDKVLYHCNLFHGKSTKIALKEDYLKNIDDSTIFSPTPGDYSVYRIPPEAREYRAITVVIDLAYPSSLALNSSYPYSFLSGRSVANGIDEALSSFTHTPSFISPTPILLDGDQGIIRLTPPMSMHTDWILSCYLAHDKDFTNIGTNMIMPISDMTVYGCQAYIYNHMIVKLNQGYLQGGLQLEAVKNIIEGYADSYEKFETALTRYRGASVYSKESLIDFLSLVMGG